MRDVVCERERCVRFDVSEVEVATLPRSVML